MNRMCTERAPRLDRPLARSAPWRTRSRSSPFLVSLSGRSLLKLLARPASAGPQVRVAASNVTLTKNGRS